MRRYHVNAFDAPSRRVRKKPNGVSFFRFPVLLLLLGMLLCPVSVSASDFLYTIKDGARLRSGPGLNHAVVFTLGHNRTLIGLDKKGRWHKVRLISGHEGWIRDDMVSDTWIKVHKKERRLYLLKGNRILAEYPAALCPNNPLGDKIKQGDGATPEGRFFLCENIRRPGQAKYGARSMRLSYPNVEDARRGLDSGLIDFKTYWGIVQAIRGGKMPNQETILGGSIRIHGGGSASDWTLGCVGLEDDHVKELFDRTPAGTRVEVYRSAEAEKKINDPGRLSRLILAGAKKQLVRPALYTDEAAAGGRLKYPLGDIRPEIAVCTDIIIRALRHAGPDLQALLYEDVRLHPARYSRWIKKPDYHIDHRRTRNLQIYFDHHTWVLPKDGDYRPGDIVTMDTGIGNGTEFDHIGIVDDAKDSRGTPKVINIWTTGYNTKPMDLLARDYPTVVGHFRLTHPFDYQ